MSVTRNEAVVEKYAMAKRRSGLEIRNGSAVGSLRELYVDRMTGVDESTEEGKWTPWIIHRNKS